MILTEEVGHRLKSFLLAHNETDSLGGFVTHEFAVADTSLFPLLLSKTVQLHAHLEDTFESFSSRLNLDFGQVNLGFMLLVSVLNVVFLLIFNFGCLSRV